MAGDRGAYRAVKVVLLDGPDYQDLPERARHLFLALKLSFGPAGIDVHYPEALAFELAAKTGMPTDAVKEALDQLEAAGWIDRERNVLWVVGQLEHDPHMSPTNERHRKAIQSHIGGLPRLAIVGRYVDRYSDYMIDAPDSLSHSLPHSPKIASRSREEGVGIRDEGRGKATIDKSIGASAPVSDTTDADGSSALTTRQLVPEVAPLVRKHLWLGKRPPPRVLEAQPKWSEGREADVVRCWLRDGEVDDLEEAQAVIRHARHALEIDGPFSLLFLHDAEGRGRFNEALQYARRQMLTEAVKTRNGADGPTRIGEGVEGVARGR